MLLALGTFVAGVHIQAWEVCALGAVTALSVPAIAWIEQSALLLLVGAGVVLAIGVALWWTSGFWNFSSHPCAPPLVAAVVSCTPAVALSGGPESGVLRRVALLAYFTSVFARFAAAISSMLRTVSGRSLP
jgi:hypothetical protein